MNEERIGTIEQVEQFLSASAPIEFSAAGNDSERYGHIHGFSSGLTTLGAASANAGCCSGTCNTPVGYSRAQITRLVTR